VNRVLSVAERVEIFNHKVGAARAASQRVMHGSIAETTRDQARDGGGSRAAILLSDAIPIGRGPSKSVKVFECSEC
jgi:hypothetical protein